MTEIVWEDPPKRKGRGRDPKFDTIIAALKQNAGRWGRISKVWTNPSAPKAFKDAGCRTKTVRNDDRKTWTIYAMFPGREAVPVMSAAAAAEKTKVQQAVRTGTALTPPPVAPPKPAPAAEVRPPDPFGLEAFKAARAARGVPSEGKR
jgi:hypothetical protein